MGRFASAVEFYARYREPYLPQFFKKVAEQIGLCGDETLLDVGCGPGLLAIGFAPFVGRCTGLDPEAAMITAAKAAAAEAGVTLSLIHGGIEKFPITQTYDVIMIGRALHSCGGAVMKAQRGVYEKILGSNDWWVRYADAVGRIRREKAGVKSAAVKLYQKRKTES